MFVPLKNLIDLIANDCHANQLFRSISDYSVINAKP